MPLDEVSEEQRTIEAKAAFLASLNSVGSNGDAALQARAKDIQANSVQLSNQEAEVTKQTEALAKSTAQYQQIANEGREKLKEIGDVQNWAEMIEKDLLVLEETLKVAEEERAEEQAVVGKDGGKSNKSGLGWW